MELLLACLLSLSLCRDEELSGWPDLPMTRTAGRHSGTPEGLVELLEPRSDTSGERTLAHLSVLHSDLGIGASRRSPVTRFVKLTTAVMFAGVVLAGCGGSGPQRQFDTSATTNHSHTYFLASRKRPRFSVIVVSSVAIPVRYFTGLKPVRRAAGRPRCAVLGRAIHGLGGPLAFMNGQLVTVKLNGSGPLLTRFCAHLRNAPFDPSTIATG
jgi:hypothetical protein